MRSVVNHSIIGKLLGMILILMLKVISVALISGESCDNIRCSNIIEYVCGEAKGWDGAIVTSKYQNICHLQKIRCRLKNVADLSQVSDDRCNIKKLVARGRGRRVFDFSIVGAHQACNHTCPTYCTDTYEPVCAQIWKKNDDNENVYNFRPMVNHCHVDLFSCAVGAREQQLFLTTSAATKYYDENGIIWFNTVPADDVTITPLARCYKNPSGLLFMTQMAAMKSLGLLEDESRRAVSEDSTRFQLERLVRRLQMP